MSAYDNPIVDNSLPGDQAELHTALLEFTYAGGRQGKKEVLIAVKNLKKVPYVPAPPGGNPVAIPSQTFFVSAGFTDLASPFFTTIQAAIDAANGVNPTLIRPYPGVYVENLTMKSNVHVMGMHRETVILKPVVGGDAVTFASAAALDISLSNLTIDATGTGAEQCLIGSLSHSGAMLRCRDVNFKTLTIVGVDLTIAMGASGCEIAFERCSLVVNGSSGCRITNTAGASWGKLRIRDCSGFLASVTSSGFEINQPGGDATIEDSVFEAAVGGATAAGGIHLTGLSYAPGNSKVLTINRCTFRVAGSTSIFSTMIYVPATPGSVFIEIANCVFDNCGVGFTGAGGSGTFDFVNSGCVAMRSWMKISDGTNNINIDGLTFAGRVAGSSAIWVVGGTPTIHMRNISLNNGKFLSTVAGIFSMTNAVIRVGTAIDAVGGGTFTIFLGNVSTDQTIAGTVTQAAGSFNVQTSLANL